MDTDNYSRRKLLRFLAASGVLLSSPLSMALPMAGDRQAELPKLILFEMFGGNDNLNTLVPFKDPLYRSYRPITGLASKEYTTISDDLAFNNALSPLFDIWDRGQLAVIQDVGSDRASLSHFKAINLMETTVAIKEKPIGWIADTIAKNAALSDKNWDLSTVWAGGHIDSLIGKNIIPYSPSRGAFSKYLNKYHIEDTSENKHILDRTINSYAAYNTMLKGRLPEVSRFAKRFHSYDSNEAFIGDQCTNVLRMIEGGVNAPVYKVGMSGFDLHSDLRGKHEILLNRAARNLANLRQSLIELDEWDNTLILAYSEFGRRPKENASHGTDHGSSGPMFLLGGKVNGGLKGERASLDKLNSDGNLHYKIDYKQVYSSVIRDFWNVEINPMADSGFMPMDGLFS